MMGGTQNKTKRFFFNFIPGIIVLGLAIFMSSIDRYQEYIERASGITSYGRGNRGYALLSIIDNIGGQFLVLILLYGFALYFFWKLYQIIR